MPVQQEWRGTAGLPMADLQLPADARTDASTKCRRGKVMGHNRKLDILAAWIWLAEARVLRNRLAYRV